MLVKVKWSEGLSIDVPISLIAQCRKDDNSNFIYNQEIIDYIFVHYPEVYAKETQGLITSSRFYEKPKDTVSYGDNDWD